MKVAIVGVGAVGSHIARRLPECGVSSLLLHDKNISTVERVGSVVGQRAPVSYFDPDSFSDQIDVVVLSLPSGNHANLAEKFLRRGCHVISTSDDVADIQQLLSLDALAHSLGVRMVIGAGLSPGISCLLVKQASKELDQIQSISVYKLGTGGPSCAKQHHRSLKRSSVEWQNGDWISKRGGSARELSWFPEPVGLKDCYAAELASSILLQPHFDDSIRIYDRVAANRRSRLTSRLPMLRPPHKDGGPGAVRVDLKGVSSGQVKNVIYGMIDYPSVSSGVLCAVLCTAICELPAPLGVSGMVSWDASLLLAELHRHGIRFARFD